VSARRCRSPLLAAALAAALAVAAPVGATQDPPPDGHHVKVPPRALRYTAEYATPSVKLVRADGRNVQLAEELDDGRPVVMDFVYTTCTTVCPVSSQTFEELESRLGAGARGRVHLVSVSIDPEEDTPRRMREYAQRFDAGPQWSFYTGTLGASETVQRAFGVFRGSKMLHEPVTLVRLAPGRPWTRFDGFVTAEELMAALAEK
jgi:protein SCO1/2